MGGGDAGTTRPRATGVAAEATGGRGTHREVHLQVADLNNT